MNEELAVKIRELESTINVGEPDGSCRSVLSYAARAVVAAFQAEETTEHVADGWHYAGGRRIAAKDSDVCYKGCHTVNKCSRCREELGDVIGDSCSVVKFPEGRQERWFCVYCVACTRKAQGESGEVDDAEERTANVVGPTADGLVGYRCNTCQVWMYAGRDHVVTWNNGTEPTVVQDGKHLMLDGVCCACLDKEAKP